MQQLHLHKLYQMEVLLTGDIKQNHQREVLLP